MEPAFIPCAICGKVQATALADEHLDAGTRYLLNECSACRAQFWTPFRNPGAAWYEHDERYADRNQDPIMVPSDKHVWTLRKLCANEGKVLDIGCGVGNFLAAAEAKGWMGWGLDFDADAIAAGKKVYGLERLSTDDLHSFIAKNEGLSFNLITFFDVLEHLDTHDAFMGDVRSLLAPEGNIALSVPYRHGWRWLLPHDLPPRHLTRWDEESMRIFLERNGFDLVAVRRLPASFYYLVLKLRFRYGSWASFGMMKVVKEHVRSRQQPAADSGSPRVPLKVRMFGIAAKTKDILLFGIPAGVLWIALLLTRKRYTDMVILAQARALA